MAVCIEAEAGAALLGKIERLEGDLARMNADLLALKAEVYQRTGDNASAEKMLKEAQGLSTSVSVCCSEMPICRPTTTRSARRPSATLSSMLAATSSPTPGFGWCS